MPAVGSPAPELALPDQHGCSVRLSDLRGRRVLVLFFPFAFTGVCTGELRAVQARLGDFQSDRLQTLAVSCDSRYSQRVFAEREGLTFPLLSDFWPHGAVASAYRMFDVERGCPLRGSVVVDEAGVLVWAGVVATARARDLDRLAALAAATDGAAASAAAARRSPAPGPQ